MTFDVPDALIDREIERRTEEFVRRLMDQGVDPRQANIDWQAFRDNQREPARENVASALVLDEVARRENLAVESESRRCRNRKVRGGHGTDQPGCARQARERRRYLASLHGFTAGEGG